MTGPTRTGVAAAARCLALDQLAADVLVAFERAEVESVLLKGAGLAQRLYPDRPDRRRYSDVDLLVAPSCFDHAQQALADLGLIDGHAGMRDDEVHWRERSWRLPGSAALTIDLHRSFAGVGDAEAFWRVISGATEPLELSGASARVPDAAGCALVVGLHAARPGRGRKAMTDLVAGLAQLSDPVWEAAADRARLTSSTDAFARGLRRDPTGVDLANRMSLPTAGSFTDQLVTRQVANSALNLARLSDFPGPRAKLRYTMQRLVPSRAYMVHNQPQAGGGTWRLAVAYALRIGRILGQTPAAAAVVIKARREPRPARRPRVRGLLRSARVVVDLNPADQLACAWALLALRRARRQLATVPLLDVIVPAPRAAGRARTSTVDRVLARAGANCLETAVVRQRWLASQGVARDVVIGVLAPGDNFRAHAWLESGPEDPPEEGFVELHRRSTPSAWLPQRPAGSRSSRP